jgi:hypothetical protein
MPVATLSEIFRPEHIVEYLAEYIQDSVLPFEWVSKYDENLIPGYPAVQVQPGPYEKDIHGTHTFLIGMRVFIYVMHAKLTQDKRSRSLDDLMLATELVDLLESDMTLGGRVIHGYVENEVPTALPPRNTRGDIVVSTRLSWHGIVERRFK